jgi:hypothetical protein
LTNQPKKKRQSNISLKSIQAKQKTINTYSTYLYDEESNTVIRYYEKFNPATTEKILKHAYENLLYAEKNNIDVFKNDISFLQYIYFLIVKFYSKLGNDLSDNLEEQIPQFISLIETGLFELFFSELFDPEEVLTVVDKIKSFMEITAQLAELDEQTRNQILESVESPVIKKKLEANNEAREDVDNG